MFVPHDRVKSRNRVDPIPWLIHDNTVRVVDAYVDELDLLTIGFARANPKATGRPGYHPSILLKLYIYGYLNRRVIQA